MSRRRPVMPMDPMQLRRAQVATAWRNEPSAPALRSWLGQATFILRCDGCRVVGYLDRLAGHVVGSTQRTQVVVLSALIPLLITERSGLRILCPLCALHPKKER